jgi:hypothetical protein
MQIDITKLPSTQFKLKELNKACEILKEMRDLDFQGYVYAFVCKQTVMKYGVQYKAGDGHGNRIYRQAFHLPGWEIPCSPNMSGDDMRDIIDEHFPDIHKDDVVIYVWDMTNFPRTVSTDPKLDINKLERQFIREHIEIYGSKPVGNIKDESHVDDQSVVSDKVFTSLFEV